MKSARYHACMHWMILAGLLIGGEFQDADANGVRSRDPLVLVFSRTLGFRHDSIEAGAQAIKELGEEMAFRVEATEEAGQFTAENLARFRAVVFLNTTGDVLDDEQQAAFEAYIRKGGGFAGVHSATDTEYDWAWYGTLVGARFLSHPEVQPATARVIEADHASTKHLPQQWKRSDEWYNFQQNPRNVVGDGLQVLIELDEQSYRGGTMGMDHPLAWCHEFEGGRSWYTAGGHTKESFSDPRFRKHLAGGIAWAGQFELDDAPPPAPARPPLKTVKLGRKVTTGGHAWEGVLTVDSDHLMFHDGEVTMPADSVKEGLVVDGSRTGVLVRNINVTGAGNGIVVQNGSSLNDVIIDRCRFVECRTPQDGAPDPLLGSRGYGMFVSAGRNWTIHRSEFTTKVRDPADPYQRDISVQYAARLGEVIGLNVDRTRFVSHVGKPCVWLMFVRNATFKRTTFEGGSLKIGVGATDIEGVNIGACENITFVDCRFEFGVFGGWPASILLQPGCRNIRLENCDFNTHADAAWWLEVDRSGVFEVTWKNCMWNGRLIEDYTGVRSELSPNEMKASGVGPAVTE